MGSPWMKMLPGRRLRTALLWMLSLAVAGFLLWAWRPALAPVDAPTTASFDAATIRRGAELTALGGCATCHSAANRATFAGGLPVETPFGTIYSTNITPDPATGIGRWSLAAFQRAMREGVDRNGRHLYPAFPYEHFTLMSDEDDAAVYAYLMTREPAQARPPPNELRFPFNIRLLLAGWKLLYLRRGPYRPDPTHDEIWNRGSYLANGPGHCGACHTPRNGLGAEIAGRSLAGGEAEGWYAYAINSASAARVPWNAEALQAYFRNGWQEQHGDAHGPMGPVAASLGSLGESDLQALATYVGWKIGAPRQSGAQGASAQSSASTTSASAANSTGGRATHSAEPPAMELNTEGAAIYAATCAGCHDGSRPLPFGGVKLELSTAVTGENATNLINVVLEGIRPPPGTAGAIMPGFASTLTDGQLESLVAYTRASIALESPWSTVESSVRAARNRARD